MSTQPKQHSHQQIPNNPSSTPFPQNHLYHQTTLNPKEEDHPRNRKDSAINIQLLQSVISSNEDIIKSQSQQIRTLHLELIKAEDDLKNEKLKNVKLDQQLKLISNSDELLKKLQTIETLEKQLHLMESELIEAKLELAIKSSDSLVIHQRQLRKKMSSQEI